MSSRLWACLLFPMLCFGNSVWSQTANKKDGLVSSVPGANVMRELASEALDRQKPLGPLSDARVITPSSARGWFWYEDPEREAEPSPEEQPVPKVGISIDAGPKQGPVLTPEQEMVNLRLRLEQMEDMTQLRAEVARYLDTAVAKPTERNLLLYMTAQQFVMARAEKFAVVWHEVLRKYPEVDDGVNNPQRSDTARPLYVNAMNNQIRTTLSGLSDRYALLFFFRGDCPYCHRQAGILQTLQRAHGFNVMPISLDGRGIPEYPNPSVEPRFVEGLGIKTVPSLMLMRKGSYVLEPIATGLTTMDVIEGRITSIVTQAEAPGGQWGKYRAERTPVQGFPQPSYQRN